jgi:tetratricopeptide (TPR) repeat protein
MESGAWSEEIILMDTAMDICSDKSDVIYAILANSRGEMECERGHCDEAYKYMKPSLEIFRSKFGEEHPEVGSGYNNYANVVLQDLRDGACEEAIAGYHKALKIFEANGPDVYKKLFHIPHTNLSRAYTVLQRFDQAIYHAEQSRKWAVEFLGEGCHFDGLADYHVGNALFAMGKHEEAEKHWLRALDLFSRENEVHPTTNAAKIKLAMVEIKRGNYDEAISMLEKILLVAKLMQASKGDDGEVARVQRKLAEAYELKGDLEKGGKLKYEAERLRKEVQGERFYELPDCDLSYAMMSFHAFW